MRVLKTIYVLQVLIDACTFKTGQNTTYRQICLSYDFYIGTAIQTVGYFIGAQPDI